MLYLPGLFLFFPPKYFQCLRQEAPGAKDCVQSLVQPGNSFQALHHHFLLKLNSLNSEMYYFPSGVNKKFSRN